MCRDDYDLWRWNEPTKHHKYCKGGLGSAPLKNNNAWAPSLQAWAPLGNNPQKIRFLSSLTSGRDIKYEREAGSHGCECTNWSQPWKMLAFLSRGRVCAHTFVGEAKDKSPASAANLILLHSSHGSWNPARSGNLIALLYILAGLFSGKL